MRSIAILVAAATTAVLLVATASPTDAAKVVKPAVAAPTIPVHVHVVAVQQVAAVEKARRAVWACQRSLDDSPLTRAALNHDGLRAAGFRYLIWIKAQWNTQLSSCRIVAAHRHRIVATLTGGLRGSPLEPWAVRFEQAGRRWNVSPYLMAAIAGQESSFGRYVSPGNAWGIGPGIAFADFGAGVDYLAEMLSQRYNMSSLYSIQSAYCPGCGEWPGKVAYFMGTFGQSSAMLRYPHRE